jgi:DNA primase
MLWLERKYLSMVISNLEMAKWKTENVLNHRCPYCGDSAKNQYKARGYHFVVEQSYIYKCHNCGKSTSSVKFLKDNFPVIHREYLKEWLKEKGLKPKAKKLPSSNEFKFTPRPESLNTKDILRKISENAWEVDVASTYLLHRKIPKTELYYVDNSELLSALSEKYKDRVLGNVPRIVIPFYDENGELVGVSGRAINNSPLRYLTLKFRDDVPLIYGLNNVDKSKTIYITEGPIDSLFLPNSIAVGGSDFKKIDNSIKRNAVLIYDNEPRNKEILKKLAEVIDLGFSVCLWDDRRVKEFKDINDMILGGLSRIDIVDIINACTHKGLSAKLKLADYKRI